MRWSLRPLRPPERPAVRRLVELYLYDLGGDRWRVDPGGAFASAAWLARFWNRRGRRHFVIRVDGRLAGFALVSDHAEFAGQGVHESVEFFVLRRYRRRGVGTRVAETLFARYPGRWELSELSWNVAAQRFWRRLIARWAAGEVVERRRRHGEHTFAVQHFEISARAGGRAARGRSPTSPGPRPSGSRRRSSRRRPGT